MSNNKKGKKRILRVAEKISSINVYWKLIVYFFVSFIGLYGVYEVIEHFKIYDMNKFATPWITFLLIAIIVSMGRYIVYLLINLANDDESTSQDLNNENDSLIAMLKDAEAHSRWAEIIKIGAALSDVLWFTSRKNLRVIIGHFVEVAATQLNDNMTLAATLIEDLGNTIMVLGNPDSGIKHIKRGIDIAEKNNYYFLIMRGYRNLANCYAMKNDPENSEIFLEKAVEVVDNITDEAKKLEAYGGIEYARCKMFQHFNKPDDALKALDTSIKYYTDLSNKYPETDNRNRDRLVKVYREKGVIYIKQNKPDEAKIALFEGLRRAQETLNHENIVRCCTLIAKIQIDNGELQPAEGILNIAKQHIGKIDTQCIRKEFFDTSKRFEVEKECKNQIDS